MMDSHGSPKKKGQKKGSKKKGKTKELVVVTVHVENKKPPPPLPQEGAMPNLWIRSLDGAIKLLDPLAAAPSAVEPSPQDRPSQMSKKKQAK